MNEIKLHVPGSGCCEWVTPCAVAECPWAAYPDSGKCWPHSLGVALRDGDEWRPRYCGGTMMAATFAEQLGGRTVEEARRQYNQTGGL